MSLKRMCFGLVAALLFPFSASAAPLSYNNLELDFYDVEIDGSPVEDEGFALGGSAEITPNIFLSGRYADSDQLQRISAGVGAHTPLAQNTSLYGVLSFEDIDIDRLNQDENGFGVEGGLRHALTTNLEVNGGVQYISIDDVAVFDDEVGYKLGATYNFTERLGLKAGANMIDDYEEFTIGGRYSF